MSQCRCLVCGLLGFEFFLWVQFVAHRCDCWLQGYRSLGQYVVSRRYALFDMQRRHVNNVSCHLRQVSMLCLWASWC